MGDTAWIQGNGFTRIETTLRRDEMLKLREFQARTMIAKGIERLNDMGDYSMSEAGDTNADARGSIAVEFVELLLDDDNISSMVDF